jgi:SnoaL-like domain
MAVARTPDIAPATEQRLVRLERVTQAQEAIRASKRLQHAYGQFLESGLWSDAADLCSKDVVAEFHIDGNIATLKGKSQLEQYLKEQAVRKSDGLAKGQLNEHFQLQPIVTVSDDGKTVRAAWHEFAMLGQYGVSASFAGGVYENEYTQENGVWKMSRLRFYQQYSGAYEAWGHKAPAKWNIPYHFEAKHVGLTIPYSVVEATESISRPTNKSSTARVAQLSARLQQLTDETAVRNLDNSFGYYLDRKRWDDVADLFADNGSFELGTSGAYVGRAHIRRLLEVLYGAPQLKTGELFEHINFAVVVTLSGDGMHASARSSQLSMLGQNGEYARWEVGVYENEFVKEQGIWKLQVVHYYPRLSTNYDEGWAKDAKPAPSPLQTFAPDVPSKATYHSYPDVQYVGFHFVNPATGKHVRNPQGAVVAVPLVSTVQMASSRAANSVETDVDAQVAKLEKQLDAAIAVDAVENLNSSYGYYIDESAWDDMADTFAANGSKEITGAGVYVGPDRIRKVLNLRGPRGGRTANFFTIHQLVQPVIHISADGNSANARMRLFQCGGSADGSSGSWIGGIYENTAFKENGEWKFGAQELHHAFNASYRNGWARVGRAVTQTTASSSSSASSGAPNPRAVIGGGIQQGLGGAASGPRIATDFPPDRPIAARQYAFPEIVEPPFHYANPVTGK